MLEVRSHPQKGRGLFTTRHVRGGEVLLAEQPLLLYVNQEMAHTACASCLKFLEAAPTGKHRAGKKLLPRVATIALSQPARVYHSV